MHFFALEEMVAEDPWARVIDIFVDILPLKEPGFRHTSLQKEGRPPYDPSLLLKIYMGHQNKILQMNKNNLQCTSI